MKYHFTLALLILAAVICITPALGADKYLGGTPEITAYLTGVNEFSPGQDATITVVIENSGTNAAVFIDQSTLDPGRSPHYGKTRHGGPLVRGCSDQHHDRPAEPWRHPSPGMTTASYYREDHLGRDARRIHPPPDRPVPGTSRTASPTSRQVRLSRTSTPR